MTAIALPPEAKLNRHSTHVLMIVTWVIGFISALPLVIFRNYTVSKIFGAIFTMSSDYLRAECDNVTAGQERGIETVDICKLDSCVTRLVRNKDVKFSRA